MQKFNEVKKMLIIAPHPDDEVLGCGGTIASLIKNRGYEAYLCVVTEGYRPDWSAKFIKNRGREIKIANQILGIAKTYFLGLPTVKLDMVSQKELNEKLASVIKKIRPEMLFIPHNGDLNIDHRLVFEASLVAARPINNFIRYVLAYETVPVGLPNIPFLPNAYCDISSTLEKKLQAMRGYASELKKEPHPRSLEIISALAKKRGSEAGLAAAEAFMLIKEIL